MISLIAYQLDKVRRDELSICSRQVISPRETDKIDSSRTVFLSRSRANRVSHETKDLLTVKSSQVGERDRTAGQEHGRRVKKETAGWRERRETWRRDREREGQETRDKSRGVTRESRSVWQWGVGWSEPGLPSACQPVSPRTLAPWRPVSRVDSHTDTSRRSRTHDAHCYIALFRMRVESGNESGPERVPLRGRH